MPAAELGRRIREGLTSPGADRESRDWQGWEWERRAWRTDGNPKSGRSGMGCYPLGTFLSLGGPDRGGAVGVYVFFMHWPVIFIRVRVRQLAE